MGPGTSQRPRAGSLEPADCEPSRAVPGARSSAAAGSTPQRAFQKAAQVSTRRAEARQVPRCWRDTML